MRQPLGVVAGITPVQFRRIPEWKFAPRLPAQRISSSSLRSAPWRAMELAKMMIDAPPGSSMSSTGDKEAVDAISTIRYPRRRLCRLLADSRNISTSVAAPPGKRAQCFGGAKNHAILIPDADMDQTVMR